ncbi:MAG: TldD/PmbA family protein [Thermoproteota archaeon]|nr:TldD/PmbA family protein [Thermoproteota archaeon]
MAELKPEELIHFGEKAVNIAMRKGADEAEAFLSQTLNTSVNIERGQIAKNMRKKDQGLGIRAVYRKAVGFSYTNILNDKSVEETAIKAFQSAQASKADKNWPGFPTPKKFVATKNTYDKKLVTISSNELVNMASNMLDEAASYDKRVFVTLGTVENRLSSRVVVNSHGVEAFDEGTSIECTLGAVAREANEVTPICMEFNAERVYKINPKWVGREAAKQAVSALKARKVDSGAFPVIFSQIALSQLLYFTFINSVKADRVQRQQSALKGKIGQKVASDFITIYDDGLMVNGLQTWKFDGEGIPCRKTPILEKGVLRHYLYDCYTAKKDGVESTGNALRRGLAPYLSTPIIEATNFTINSGNKSAEDLIGEVNNGVIVYGLQGAHSSNPATGEFSVVATPAWKIENGEIAYAIKGAMLAGVIFDVLNNVSALGNNVRKIERIVTPWIRVENVKVVGK